MSQLFQAMNKTATTDNGAVAYHSSLSANLDFFYLAGASRGKDISFKFTQALAENPELALRTLQWLRDVRGGAGERQLFRELTKLVVEKFGSESNEVVSILPKIPELGRYDDLLWLSENCPMISDFSLHIYKNGLQENNGLAFKWCPIKGDTAKKLRKMCGFKKEADWRKYVVAGRKVVEQQMCAKQWDEIEFGKVPSLASARYQKAFGRNAPEKYGQYIASLQKGEAKINAGAVYPYDILKSCYVGNVDVAEQQWKALPDYLEGTSERILPLIDVSSSMSCPAGGNRTLQCVDVAISLGWYIAERTVGIFNRIFMTFEDTPKMLKMNENLPLVDVFKGISQAPWGGSTNIMKAFEVLLNAAVTNKVPESEMPTQILVLSDMQFNSMNVEGNNVSMFEMAKQLYENHGYKLPRIVFWNLNAQNQSIPVTQHETGTAMVSGFSPAIMKPLLKGGLTPEQVMLDTVMVDRYKL